MLIGGETRPKLAWRAIQQGIKSAGTDEWGRSRYWWWRVGYSIKAAICVLADRFHDYPSTSAETPHHDHVMVAAWGFHSYLGDYGTVRSWDELQVGWGWRRRGSWHVHINGNGD